MKLITTLCLALLVLLGLTGAVQAQQDVATITFQLTVEGSACANTTYWGNFGLAQTEDVQYVQLFDPEGDGTYTVSTNVPTGQAYYLYLWQGTGATKITTPTGQLLDAPGEPRQLIRDFSGTTQTGTGLTVTEDLVLEASVAGCQAPSDGTPPSDAVDVQFRLNVTGGPCTNATYYAVFGVPQSEFFSEQLTDPDGDGVYTLTRQLGANSPLYISIQQGIGSVQSQPSLYLLPGPPRSTVRDFGLVTPTQNMSFEASVAGCPGDTPSALPDTGTGNYLPLMALSGSLIVLAGGGYLRRRAAGPR